MGVYLSALRPGVTISGENAGKMKRIYLDWGVVSNLKKPEYVDIREFLISHKGELFFVYSSAHFEDAMRSEGDERLQQDIQMLESLVDNHLLCYNQKEKTASPYLATPSEYYRGHKGQNLDLIPNFPELVSAIDKDVPLVGGLLKTFLDIPFPIPEAIRSQELWGMILPDLPDSPTLGDVINSGVSFFNKMQGEKGYYKSYRSAVRATGFSLDPNAGNWRSDEVVSNISARMKAMGIDKSFKDFVLMGFGDKEKVDDFLLFITAYSLLDMIGYKSDKLPKASIAMNSVNTDAQHAYFAACCDYLITQDTNLASKAQALYHEFKISTKVIPPQEVITELSEDRNDDLVSFLNEQLKEENVEKREDGATTFKFTKRFLGIFSHCIVYKKDSDGITLLVFKLAFDNCSGFIFFDEAGFMVDTVCEYFGWPPQEDYEIARKRIVAGDPGASINWQGEEVRYTLKADPEYHRPELFVKVTAQ
jgi:hypothetical protein